LRSLGQHVDDGTLALVAPLRADHNNILSHSLFRGPGRSGAPPPVLNES
jgi:hypothetical protein